jgi:hypothetical protein
MALGKSIRPTRRRDSLDLTALTLGIPLLQSRRTLKLPKFPVPEVDKISFFPATPILPN